MPPIQWVRLRQKRIDFGRISMSVRMDEPVVVKPETDSNQASTFEGISLLMMYGKAPIPAIRNQAKLTVRYASFFLNWVGALFRIFR